METEQLYDVVVFHKTTKEIVEIIGSKMKLCDGRVNAQKRYASQIDRIGVKYAMDIVETGTFPKGSIYK